MDLETSTPERIAAAMAEGEKCLRANGHDFPAELNAIGAQEGEKREVIRPWGPVTFKDGTTADAWRSVYQWTTRKLRAEHRLISFLRGGWIWLGGRNVGVWLLISSGSRKRETPSV